ncbi:MAG: hypothetical protein AAC990_06010 [Dehalococcoides mccartyi]|uniref:hypothetical protein n=1 Tax=Dehalococcoides mccartyi TaxID=61435 RepID=UPI0030F7481A
MLEQTLEVVTQSLPLWERLVSIIAPLIGGALAVIGGILLERSKSKRQRRREHLQAIQKRVLAPLEERIKIRLINSFIVKENNIEIKDEARIRPDIKATEYSKTQRPILGIHRADSPGTEPPSDALYECAKAVHFTPIIHDYEQVEADFEKYNSKCLQYVNSLSDLIIEQLSLPEEPTQPLGPYVRADALALHIYERQRGYQALPVRLRAVITESVNTIEGPESDGLVINIDQVLVTQALDLITHLERERHVVDELESTASDIFNQAFKLGLSLEKAKNTNILVGSCELLKE